MFCLLYHTALPISIIFQKSHQNVLKYNEIVSERTLEELQILDLADCFATAHIRYAKCGMINLRRGELCSPAKSNSYLYFGRTQFAPTGFKLKFEKTDKPQFISILNHSVNCIQTVAFKHAHRGFDILKCRFGLGKGTIKPESLIS